MEVTLDEAVNYLVGGHVLGKRSMRMAVIFKVPRHRRCAPEVPVVPPDVLVTIIAFQVPVARAVIASVSDGLVPGKHGLYDVKGFVERDGGYPFRILINLRGKVAASRPGPWLLLVHGHLGEGQPGRSGRPVDE